MGKAAILSSPDHHSHPLLQQTSDHNLQRKAAIACGAGTDHSGSVVVVPLEEFDLNKTIFSTLEGALPRMVIEAKIANSVYWNDTAAARIEEAYRKATENVTIPDVDPKIIDFILTECNFDMEHADGSFLEHLLFGHEYSFIHFPEYSPTVTLLHSILGTATNTFAMEAHKIPMLKELLTDFEMVHIEAFPSVLRLLSELRLPEMLNDNMGRLDKLESISFHRVIDNQRVTMDAENFWIQLNYQLVHFIDFLPAANWSEHASDPVLQTFKDLSDLLDRAGKRTAKVDLPMKEKAFSIPSLKEPRGETLTLGGRVSSLIPSIVKKKLAAKSIRKFSERINHSLDFELTWK